MQGKRSSQEDTVVCTFEERDGTEVGCFGVFDGARTRREDARAGEMGRSCGNAIGQKLQWRVMG